MRVLLLSALALFTRSVVLGAQVDTAKAIAGASEFSAACAHDRGRTWGRSLCGPMLLIDRATRFAIATERPPTGRFEIAGKLWMGTLPEDFTTFANTAFEWQGRRWSTVLLPLPDLRFDRIALLIHESFHRIQPELGLIRPDAINPHLDERDGRFLLRLEIRALSAGLAAKPAERIDPLRDALTFRTERHRLFPQADSLERMLEVQEGLAQYTGVLIAMAETREGIEPVLAGARSFEGGTSYVRSLGYGTGPLLGLTLDRLVPGWRSRAGAGPGAILAAAVGTSSAGALSLGERAARYGGAEVAAAEDARASQRATLLADYRRLLVEGPVLRLGADRLMRSFNPNSLIPLGEHGTIYPTGAFSAAWGKLTVTEGGSLVDPTLKAVSIPAPIGIDSTAGAFAGPGWSLELAPGWRLRGGPRKGDWRAVETK